jgi:hypothetical protein
MNNIETVGSSGSEKDLTDTEGSAGTRTSEIMGTGNLYRVHTQAVPPVNLVLRMRWVGSVLLHC